MSYIFFFLDCDDLVLGLVGFGFGLFVWLGFFEMLGVVFDFVLVLCVCTCVLHERILSSQSS